MTYVSEKSLEDVYDNVLKKCESVGAKLNLKFTSKNLAGKNKVELTFQGGQGVVKLAVTIQQVSETPRMYWISLAKLRGPLLSYVSVLRALQQPDVKSESSEGDALPALDDMLGGSASA